MNDEEDSAEMKSAKHATHIGMGIVLIGASMVLALGLWIVTDPTAVAANYVSLWGGLAGVATVITFVGMGVSMVGEGRQRAILNREINELLVKIIEKLQEKQG